MDRLTGKHYGRGDYYMVCSGSCANDDEMCGGCPWLEKIINRLGSYEDTDLEPEEIEKAMEDCADTVAKNQFAISDIGVVAHADITKISHGPASTEIARTALALLIQRIPANTGRKLNVHNERNAEHRPELRLC